MLERLSYFDVKRSVLEFGQLCANYRIMLRKHFRSYKELIHYSSATFYQGQLQAIADSTHAGRVFHLMPGQRSTA